MFLYEENKTYSILHKTMRTQLLLDYIQVSIYNKDNLVSKESLLLIIINARYIYVRLYSGEHIQQR